MLPTDHQIISLEILELILWSKFILLLRDGMDCALLLDINSNCIVTKTEQNYMKWYLCGPQTTVCNIYHNNVAFD